MTKNSIKDRYANLWLYYNRFNNSLIKLYCLWCIRDFIGVHYASTSIASISAYRSDLKRNKSLQSSLTNTHL